MEMVNDIEKCVNIATLNARMYQKKRNMCEWLNAVEKITRVKNFIKFGDEFKILFFSILESDLMIWGQS